MRSYTLVFVALATILLYAEYVNAKEICRQENCVSPDKCEVLMNTQSYCAEQGTSCCSVVKLEYRTHCHQYGGQCMKYYCSASLQHKAEDCLEEEKCCALV